MRVLAEYDTETEDWFPPAAVFPGGGGGGVATGGTTGQFLVKASATDYDTSWFSLNLNLDGGSPTSVGGSFLVVDGGVP